MIFYKLWAGGLFNQVISYENAYVISNALNKEISIHSQILLNSSWRINDNRNNLLGRQYPKLSDIIIAPNNIQFLNENICSDMQQVSFFTTCISLDGSCPPTEFLDSRNWLELNKDLQYKDTLGWKSIIFWSSDSTAKKELLNKSSIQFKQCYINLANKIATQLGDFAAIHVRRLIVIK